MSSIDGAIVSIGESMSAIARASASIASSIAKIDELIAHVDASIDAIDDPTAHVDRAIARSAGSGAVVGEGPFWTPFSNHAATDKSEAKLHGVFIDGGNDADVEREKTGETIMSSKQAVAVKNPNVGGITSADVTNFVDQLTTIASVVSEGYDALTDLERKHVPRARTSILDALPKLIALSQAQEVDPAGVARVEAGKAFLDLLAPLVTTAQSLVEVLGDVVLELQGDVSTESRALYGQLKGKAKANPRLKTSLEPLGAIFKTSRGSSKTAAGGAAADGASETPAQETVTSTTAANAAVGTHAGT
jgi:hypothetical protein